jgi:hypothetical protein
MGYNVEIIRSTAKIPAANLKRAYDKMCALNTTHHGQKRGGSYSGGGKTESWFSWMDANYPETCADAQAVLEQLGFYTEFDQQGDLLITGYDSKMGQEDLFLKAIENEASGEIEWVGEDHERWTTVLRGDNVIDAESPTRLLAN